MVEKLRPFINGNYVESKTDKYCVGLQRDTYKNN